MRATAMDPPTRNERHNRFVGRQRRARRAAYSRLDNAMAMDDSEKVERKKCGGRGDAANVIAEAPDNVCRRRGAVAGRSTHKLKNQFEFYVRKIVTTRF